ncbi:MAG: hypothetical protein K9N62_15065 [Verrucomicrobia bacterium]|nr:hypothetical protein [Verrucomicrobiota bacterium]
MRQNRKTTSPSLEECNHILNLASDKGLCGDILRKIDPAILSAAADSPNPWEYLLGLADGTKELQNFCRAANSVQDGTRLARMAWNCATPRTDWGEELTKAAHSADRSMPPGLSQKIFERMESAKPGYLASVAPPHMKRAIEAEAALYWKRRRRKEGLKGGTASNVTAPDIRQVQSEYSFEWFLFTGWLRLPDGMPGLCFFSRTALANLFHILDIKEYSSESDPKFPMKTRLRRLELVQGPSLIRFVLKREDGRIDLTYATGKKHELLCGLKIGDRVIYTRSL